MHVWSALTWERCEAIFLGRLVHTYAAAIRFELHISPFLHYTFMSFSSSSESAVDVYPGRIALDKAIMHTGLPFRCSETSCSQDEAICKWPLSQPAVTKTDNSIQ